jgi:hypothetical protein
MPSGDSKAPHLNVEFAHRLADKLFPAWAEMKRLVAQIEQLERDRAQLLKTEVSHLHPHCTSRHALTFQLPEIKGFSDEMYHEKKRAASLMHQIMAFELDQNVRVERIEKDIIDAEAFINDIKAGELQAKNQMLVEVLRRGQLLPFESSKLNWEVDTNDEDEAAKPGGLSKGIS